MSTSDEEMLVVSSIRQAFEMHGCGGSAVQATQNPFIINVNGQFDLLKTAALIISNLDARRAHKAKIAQDEAARQAQEVAKAKLAANADLE